MKIKLSDNTFKEVKVIDVNRVININYSLIEATSGKLRSVDRGAGTDQYTCKFTFHGIRDEIYSLYSAFSDLRDNNLPVNMIECEERYFAANIIHDNITASIMSVGEITSPIFKSFTFEITLMLDKTSVLFDGIPLIPAAMRCLRTDFSGYSTWSTVHNSTYTGNAYVSNRGAAADKFMFNGEYLLKDNELRNLLSFHKHYRGSEFQITESNFGTSFMFGPETSDTVHNVIITDLSYKSDAPNYNIVKIELVKQ